MIQQQFQRLSRATRSTIHTSFPSAFFASSPLPSFHPSAQTGFTKDNISRYELGRPTYPVEAMNFIIQLLRQSRVGDSYNIPPSLLEIGAGTGKFTTTFLEITTQDDWLKNCHYLALEPSEFIEKLKSLNLNIQIEKGMAENIPVAKDQTIDGVLIAQAFHWMSNKQSIQEIHRVLKKNHPLILIWNGYDTNINWIQQFEKEIILPRYPADTPKYQSGEWENIFHNSLGKSLFQPIQKFTCYNSIQGSISMIVNRALSTSVISNQSEDIRKQVEKQIYELLSSHPQTRDIPIDSPNGFTMRYQTLVAYTFAL